MYNFRNPIVLRDGRIDCEIEITPDRWVPYTASPEDTEEKGRNFFMELHLHPNKAVQGPKTDAELASDHRKERAERLLIVDQVASNFLRWSDLTASNQSAYRTYRRALLDVPQQAGFPHTVVWPVLTLT